MKRNGKISKSVLITIIVLACLLVIGAVAVFGLFTFNKINKAKQEKLISDEVNSMYTSQKVDNQLKTTGKFAKVEAAIKEYYTEYINSSKDLLDIYSQNLLSNSLSATNISSDGPEFNKTKESITKIKNTESETNSKYAKLASDEYINNKANELNLNDYYTDLYISLINDNLKVKDDTTKIKEVTEAYDKWIGKVEDVLNFLTENKANWKVSGSNIMFTSNALVTRYNTLLTSLKTEQSLLKIKLNTLKY